MQSRANKCIESTYAEDMFTTCKLRASLSLRCEQS